MIDKARLYKLPWTRDNNPNGWIEPTTYCQLKCPMCYRGLDIDGFRPFHMDLDEAKRDVDRLVATRRVGTMSIAGGEPLLYPHLDQLVDHIRAKGVEVMILTNGIRLDEAFLRRLRDKEVARVVIHIDKHQGRKGIDTEEAANELRRSFCDLFRRVGGISLGFIQPLGIDDLADLDVLIPFFKQNADVIDLVTFNRLQPVDENLLPRDRILQGARLFERVREIYGIDYAAYLGKTHSDDVAWLFGQAVFAGDRVIGSLDQHAFRRIQETHLRKTGQYRHCSRNGRMSAGLLPQLVLNRSLRNITFNYLKQVFKARRPNLQLVLIVNTPSMVDGGDYDRCEGCPDAMYFGDKLVPSCLLEKIKEGVEIEAT